MNTVYIIKFTNGSYYKKSYDCFHGHQGNLRQATRWKTRVSAERNAARMTDTAGAGSYRAGAVVVEVTA